MSSVQLIAQLEQRLTAGMNKRLHLNGPVSNLPRGVHMVAVSLKTFTQNPGFVDSTARPFIII